MICTCKKPLPSPHGTCRRCQSKLPGLTMAEAEAERAAKATVTLTLDASLVKAIDDYLDGDWNMDGKDPSAVSGIRMRALNAVSYIGERVAGIRAAQRKAGKPQ